MERRGAGPDRFKSWAGSSQADPQGGTSHSPQFEHQQQHHQQRQQRRHLHGVAARTMPVAPQTPHPHPHSHQQQQSQQEWPQGQQCLAPAQPPYGFYPAPVGYLVHYPAWPVTAGQGGLVYGAFPAVPMCGPAPLCPAPVLISPATGFLQPCHSLPASAPTLMTTPSAAAAAPRLSSSSSTSTVGPSSGQHQQPGTHVRRRAGAFRPSLCPEGLSLPSSSSVVSQAALSDFAFTPSSGSQLSRGMANAQALTSKLRHRCSHSNASSGYFSDPDCGTDDCVDSFVESTSSEYISPNYPISSEASSWSSLTAGILQRVLSKLQFQDMGQAFRQVCRHWRAVFDANITQLSPNLMKSRLIVLRFQNLHALHLTHCANIRNRDLYIISRSGVRLRTLTLGDDCTKPWVTNRGLTYISNITTLTSIDLQDCNSVTNNGLIALQALTALHSLSLKGCRKLTNGGMDALTLLSSLHSLNLLGVNRLSCRGLQALTRLSGLSNMKLGHTRIRDEGLGYLAQITTLTSLSLTHEDVTDAGLCKLATLTGLSSLGIRDCTTVSGDTVAHLLRSLPHLQALDLKRCQGFTDEHLAKCMDGQAMAGITSLDIRSTAVTHDGAALLAGVSGLRTLKLSVQADTAVEGYAGALAALAQLTSITVGGLTNLPVELLTALQAVPHLQELDVSIEEALPPQHHHHHHHAASAGPTDAMADASAQPAEVEDAHATPSDGTSDAAAVAPAVAQDTATSMGSAAPEAEAAGSANAASAGNAATSGPCASAGSVPAGAASPAELAEASRGVVDTLDTDTAATAPVEPSEPEAHLPTVPAPVPLSQSALEALCALPTLTRLDVLRHGITGEQLQQLVGSLPRLKEVNVASTGLPETITGELFDQYPNCVIKRRLSYAAHASSTHASRSSIDAEILA